MNHQAPFTTPTATTAPPPSIDTAPPTEAGLPAPVDEHEAVTPESLQREGLSYERLLHTLTWDETAIPTELAREIEAGFAVLNLAIRSDDSIGLSEEALSITIGSLERRAGLLAHLLEEQRKVQRASRGAS